MAVDPNQPYRVFCRSIFEFCIFEKCPTDYDDHSCTQNYSSFLLCTRSAVYLFMCACYNPLLIIIEWDIGWIFPAFYVLGVSDTLLSSPCKNYIRLILIQDIRHPRSGSQNKATSCFAYLVFPKFLNFLCCMNTTRIIQNLIKWCW